MTDREMAESAVRGLAREFGLELPVELIVETAAALASRLSGKGWDEAILAGKHAAERITSEAAAEKSRRERVGES